MKAKNLYYVMALCAGSFAFSNVANAQDVFVDDAVSVTELRQLQPLFLKLA